MIIPKKVPFIKPRITKFDILRAVKSVNSGWLTHHTYTEIFERELTSKLMLSGKKALMTSSCTASLEMALMLAELSPGDTVITTPLSYVATSNVILFQNLNLIFVDVDPSTGLITPEGVEKALTEDTKAVIVVHLYGQMADMVGFHALGRKYNLKIIEDAAHCLEGSRDGVSPGELSFAAAFSFHSAKNITSGQGGALAIADNLASRAKLIRRDGIYNDLNDVRVMEMLGKKFDSTDFQAALLIGQLRRVKKQHESRLNSLRLYKDFFDRNGIENLSIEKNVLHAAHLITVQVDKNERTDIRNYLKNRNISTSIHYNPIHLEPYYRKTFGFSEGTFPNAEKIGLSSISLPLYAKMKKTELKYVCSELLKALRSYKS
jgi:dTDP-4-amino-4,6-dideoxygalactose transaminase